MSWSGPPNAPGLEFETISPFPSNTGDDTAELTSLINNGQTDILLRTNTYKLGALSAIRGKSGVKIRGAGRSRSIVQASAAAAASTIFDLTNAQHCELTDFTLTTAAQRSVNPFILLDGGVGSCLYNQVRRLRLVSGFLGIKLNDCGLNSVDEILMGDANTGWGWSSLVDFTGQAVSNDVDRLRGGTAAGCTNGIVRFNSANLDTNHGSDWDLQFQSPATGMIGVVSNGGTWTKLGRCSVESGDQDALTVNGGTQFHMFDPHLYGRAFINGGNVVQLHGGEVFKSGSNGILLNAGVGTEIHGVCVHDILVGWNAIAVAANVSDFSLIGNDLGRNILGAGGVLASLIVVAAGTSDRYVIDLNKGRNFSGTALSDGGTGTNKRVGAVPTSNVFVA